MTTALTTQSTDFNDEQIELIKRTICKGASTDELKLFLNQAKRTGLDPFSRQIYAIRRKTYEDGEYKEAQIIQLSVDGLRVIAERSGKYAGQVGPYWCGEDGIWKEVWLNGNPAAAKIGILRHDFKEPLWAVARFDSYAGRKKDGSLTTLWARMSDVMIAKCAESNALRKAFPQDLSGLYAGEEMDQANNPHPVIANRYLPTALDTETGEILGSSTLPIRANPLDYEDPFQQEMDVIEAENSNGSSIEAKQSEAPTKSDFNDLQSFASLNGWTKDMLNEHCTSLWGEDYRKKFTKSMIGDIKTAIIEWSVKADRAIA